MLEEDQHWLKHAFENNKKTHEPRSRFTAAPSPLPTLNAPVLLNYRDACARDATGTGRPSGELGELPHLLRDRDAGDDLHPRAVRIPEKVNHIMSYKGGGV